MTIWDSLEINKVWGLHLDLILSTSVHTPENCSCFLPLLCDKRLQKINEGNGSMHHYSGLLASSKGKEELHGHEYFSQSGDLNTEKPRMYETTGRQNWLLWLY